MGKVVGLFDRKEVKPEIKIAKEYSDLLMLKTGDQFFRNVDDNADKEKNRSYLMTFLDSKEDKHGLEILAAWGQFSIKFYVLKGDYRPDQYSNLTILPEFSTDFAVGNESKLPNLNIIMRFSAMDNVLHQYHSMMTWLDQDKIPRTNKHGAMATLQERILMFVEEKIDKPRLMALKS